MPDDGCRVKLTDVETRQGKRVLLRVVVQNLLLKTLQTSIAQVPTVEICAQIQKSSKRQDDHVCRNHQQHDYHYGKRLTQFPQQLLFSLSGDFMSSLPVDTRCVARSVTLLGISCRHRTQTVTLGGLLLLEVGHVWLLGAHVERVDRDLMLLVDPFFGDDDLVWLVGKVDHVECRWRRRGEGTEPVGG